VACYFKGRIKTKGVWNNVTTQIYGSTADKISEQFKNINNEKICDLYGSSVIKMVKCSTLFLSANSRKMFSLQIVKKMKDKIHMNIRMDEGQWDGIKIMSNQRLAVCWIPVSSATPLVE
jgi:hypothetical protein